MLRPYRRSFGADFAQEMRARGWWRGRTIFDLLREAADRYGDHLALADERRRLSFAQTLAAVCRAALLLREHRIGPGSVVALQVGASASFHLLHHAVALVRAVTLPVPTDLRRADTEVLLKNGDADVLIVRAEPYRGSSGEHDFVATALALREGIPGLREVWSVDGDSGGRADVDLDGALSAPELAAADGCAPHGFAPEALDDMLMLPTAGTTGVPRLTLRCHEAWLAMAASRAEKLAGLALGPSDSLLCLATPAQGVGYMNGFLLPLTFPGMAVHLRSRFDASRALAAVAAERITVLAGVPAQFLRMSQAPTFESAPLGSVRLLLAGGADFPADARRLWEERTGAPLILGYGASDVGLVASPAVSDPPERRYRTVGRPFSATKVRILDERGVDLPRGTVGEIATRGPDLPTAFYRDDERTAAIGAEGGFTRLGDLAVLDEDGYLRVVGRAKDLIVRGGQNISAAEVEAHLSAMPGVREVAVVPAPDPVLGEVVCAVVVPARPEDPPSLERLRSWLSDAGLARHKLPERAMVVGALPLTATGKVDKRSVAAAVAARDEPTGSIS